MKIGFAGAGKAGFSLGKMFVEKGLHVIGYWSRQVESAREAATFTRTEYFEELSQLIAQCDTIFLTVSDDAIQSVYEQLISSDIAGKQICHVSGSLAAKEVFQNIEQYGAFGFSIHPLFPISDKYLSYQKLADAFFCLEGHGETVDTWCAALEALHLKVRKIDGENKAKYHAACVFSSNLFCALLQESVELMEQVGFSQEDAREALAPLILANMESALKKGPIAALTGPVERGDVNTVRKHLKCFETQEEKDMYTEISKKLVKMAKVKNPERDYSQLSNVLVEGVKE